MLKCVGNLIHYASASQSGGPRTNGRRSAEGWLERKKNSISLLKLLKTAGRIMNCVLDSVTVYVYVYTAHGIYLCYTYSKLAPAEFALSQCRHIRPQKFHSKLAAGCNAI